jgi:flagellar hook-length control protein FliK
MNIQMILSALPTQPSGKLEPGAAPGQFALALDQAGQLSLPQGHAELANRKPGDDLAQTLPQALPQTMAAQQALLQALHGEQPLDSKVDLDQTDANLDEIMARLALIDASYSQAPQASEAMDALAMLNTPQQEGAESETAALGSPQVAALAAAVATDSARPADTEASARRTDALPMSTNGGHALPGEARPGTPAAANLAAAAAERSQVDTAAPARLASDGSAQASALAKVAAAQPGARELRAPVAETARGGFMPEAATMPQPATTSSGQASPATQPALPVQQAALATPVQSQAWPGQLGQQLVQFVRLGGEQQVEMRLNPAELGPLSVTLKMTEQGAQAQFLAAHSQVRQVLEQAIPQLRETLAEQGITLGDTSVGEQRRQDAQTFAGQNGEQGRQGAGQGEVGAELAAAEDPGAGMSGATAVSLDGRVNLYA